MGNDADVARQSGIGARVKIVIFDYGAGNLHSLVKALEADDAMIDIETDISRAVRADVLVLPGVGAFGAAVGRLAGARQLMRDAILGGLPTIGICLGMQLLFDRSEESIGDGLGVIHGVVTRLVAKRVPQIGWNEIVPADDDSWFTGSALRMAYYANSFVCRPKDAHVVSAWTTHEGDCFPAAVRVANTVGVQFHPEKSSVDGVRFLRALVQDVRGSVVRR